MHTGCTWNGGPGAKEYGWKCNYKVTDAIELKYPYDKVADEPHPETVCT